MQQAPTTIGVSVSKGKKKGGKNKPNLYDQYENQKSSNYELLVKLGFDEQLIEENKKLGLKPK